MFYCIFSQTNVAFQPPFKKKKNILPALPLGTVVLVYVYIYSISQK